MSVDSLRYAAGIGVVVLVYGGIIVSAALGYALDPLDLGLVVCSGLALLCSVAASRYERTDVGLVGHGFSTVAAGFWAVQRPSSMFSLGVVALVSLGFVVQTYNVATDSEFLRWTA